MPVLAMTSLLIKFSFTVDVFRHCPDFYARAKAWSQRHVTVSKFSDGITAFSRTIAKHLRRINGDCIHVIHNMKTLERLNFLVFRSLSLMFSRVK